VRHLRRHTERHQGGRAGWLRAVVLGANDGIVSTASLIAGVAAGDASSASVAIAGVAALVAGALSMAAGEYVSVSSQADIEQADLAVEKQELKDDYNFERNELAAIYRRRGVEHELARQVADQLMAEDALAAHARDELGISEITTPHPVQAALASAASFSAGAALPLLVAVLSPPALVIPAVMVASLLCLALLGAIAARAAGAEIVRPTIRVTAWGALAMAVTAAIGKAVGMAV
jgi:VIT1/CCC1 family predicted Fe2+/Mn2+ transporter